MESNELNVLLNKVLGTTNQEYSHGKKQIDIFKNNFLLKIKNNIIKKKIFSFFFPCESAIEKNIEDFWFMKYRNNNSYNEYSFSIDLLKSFIQYMSDNDETKFNRNIEDFSKKFGTYKNFDYFLSIIKGYLDLFLAIEAFFTKDYLYFENNFEIIRASTDIQSKEFINQIKSKILSKIDSIQLKEELKNMKQIMQSMQNIMNIYKLKFNLLEKSKTEAETKIQNLEKAKAEAEIKIKNLEKTKAESDIKIQNLDIKIQNLEKSNEEKDDKIKTLETRLNRIELRDTIKMSFKYIYNILYFHFNIGEYESNFLRQIEIIKSTLQTKFSNKYNYISEFIENIEFEESQGLNKTANSLEQERKLDDIKKYLHGLSNIDLDKVLKFFKDLPFINDFISLNLKYYFNPTKAENEFKKKISYDEVYKKIFENNN